MGQRQQHARTGSDAEALSETKRRISCIDLHNFLKVKMQLSAKLQTDGDDDYFTKRRPEPRKAIVKKTPQTNTTPASEPALNRPPQQPQPRRGPSAGYKMPSRRQKQALPFRLSYLDTQRLSERLTEIYQSEDNFDLTVCR